MDYRLTGIPGTTGIFRRALVLAPGRGVLAGGADRLGARERGGQRRPAHRRGPGADYIPLQGVRKVTIRMGTSGIIRIPTT